jgi:hypothetical protein
LHAVPPRKSDRENGFQLLRNRQKGRPISSLIGIQTCTPSVVEAKSSLWTGSRARDHVGTGSEDYVGLAWGIQNAPFLYNGCSLNVKSFVTMYRWHLPDPIAWRKECRITIQQIAYKDGLKETHDDWSCATFWYEPVPSAALPGFPDVKAHRRHLENNG